LGVNTSGILQLDGASGHAIISIAPDGENAITLFPGTNITISSDMVTSWLSEIGPQDWLVLQNETSQQRMAASLA
jgi:ribokinase